ncbi:hypothetical protein N9A26_00090 [bacterium]|nr:hypothetical protein [bacterium]
MKKLLILLLLIPTLIQAEEFNLVCEGEMLYMSDSTDGHKEKKTMVVKVGEKSIVIDDWPPYRNRKGKWGLGGTIETNYLKNSELISVYETTRDKPDNKNCRVVDFTADIDRISGVIKREMRETDRCRDKSFFWHSIYRGKCKKQKGNAF